MKLNSKKLSNTEQEFGNRYKFKHHILGMFFGAVAGGLFGAIIGTEQAIGGGIIAGLILGEIIGVIYTQFV